MRRMRPLVPVSLLIGLLLSVPGVSSAASHETHGWWWRPQTGLLGVELPPPPDVPEDGLLVERAPDGATAVSAVRYELAEGESAPVLTLTVASGESAGAAVAACQTNRTGWQGEQGGRWDAAPGWDCEAGRVDGVASDDGSTWSWELAPLVRNGVLSVMLVDGTSNPFHLAFEAPTDASMQTQRAPAPPPDAPDPVAPPPPAYEDDSPPPSDPPPSSSGSVFVPPSVSRAPAPPPVQPAPEVAAPDGSGSAPPPAAPVGTPAAAPASTDDELPPLAYVLLGAIGTLVLTDLTGRGRPNLSRPWRSPATDTGGIGRFARDRTERPAPLW